jgi:hypothetical protein
MKKNSLTLRTIILILFVQFLQITSLYSAPAKPVITRQPAGATYAKNATARFYVNAYSIDGGYLEYQWYRSAMFSVPQSDVRVIKTGATSLSEGISATFTTTTPAVAGYYYYWVEITNNKDGASSSIESSLALTKIVNRTLHTSLMQGNFSAMGTGVNVQIGAYWNTTHDGRTSDPTCGFTGNSNNPKKVLEIHSASTYGTYSNYDNNNLVCELSVYVASSNYQDIATMPGKIYEWSLDHSSRRSLATNPQVMAIIIGPAINTISDYKDFGITNHWINDPNALPDKVYPYGRNYTTYFYDILNKLAKDLNTTVTALRKLSPNNSAPHTAVYGGNTYYIYLSSDQNDAYWVHRSGVYTVPAGQGTTVFGFVPITLDNGYGNLIDNVIFASGSPPVLSPTISYDNTVKLSAPTKSGYVYGIAEVRGSSVILVPTAAYYDPDGTGASAEVAVSKTSGLGIDGWYSTYGSNSPFTNNGVITFKNLTPGKTYRIVGIPLLAVNIGLHANESPEYVLDEGYYKDVRIPPAYEGNATIIWNVDVDTYMDGATERARAIVKNARNDVEYALLADSIDAAGNHIPATSRPAHLHTDWTPGTSEYVIFDNLALDTYYYLVARPYGYDETTYAGAAYDINGLKPVYIRIKTPGVNIKDIDPSNVSRSSNCLSIELRNSKTGYTYAVVDPETGTIIGVTTNGKNGATLTFPVPKASKTYQIITRSDNTNWFRGVRVYGCVDDFFIDYRNELVKSPYNVNGNIPTNVKYRIRSNNADNTWIVGDADTWTSGLGTQPVNLSIRILGGNTTGILDSITALAANATIYYTQEGLDGYTGQSIYPVKELVIPKRPAAPTPAVNYVFDYINEKITVISDSLHFAQRNVSQWTSLLKNASWTFADAGWGEGASKKPFNARIPATTASFASVVRTDTILARPDAPDVSLESNKTLSKIVITDMIDGIKYQYYTDISATWVTYVPTGGTTKSDSINFAPNANCYVRLAATTTAPASFITVLASPISIQPVYFISYAYGSAPVSKKVVIKSVVSAVVNVTSVELYGANSSNYHFVVAPDIPADKQVPARGTNTNWELIPNNNLDAGTYNTQLKMTYTYNSMAYTAYANVYLTVEKTCWNMSGIQGKFDVSQTKAQQLVLNIAGAPVGSRLSYYYGSTQAPGYPESTVVSNGATSYTFTSANGLQPSSIYPVLVIAKEDDNHYASLLTVIATGYTAYATPVFDDIVVVDYINERLTFVSGYNSADYTIRCTSCNSSPIISSPYSLYNILEDINNSNIVLSIVHNAGVNPPYPASDPGYSGTIPGRPAAPAINGNSITHASTATSYDGKIDVAGLFAYRIHGTTTWSSASNSAIDLGVGDYDVRYPATATSFASRWVMATVSTITGQPLSVSVVECCIHDTLSVAIPSTTNTVKYQWYSNTSNSNVGGSKIINATERSFPIPVGLTAGKYYYYCTIVIGDVTVLVSSAAIVTVVNGLPKYISSVQPAVVCVGGNIRLNFYGISPYNVYYTIDDGITTKGNSFFVTGSDTTIIANTHGVYTFKNMLDGYVCLCTIATVRVNPRVISGVSGNDETICYGAVPKRLTTTPASGGVSGDYIYQWLHSIDNGKTWTTISGVESKDYQPGILKQTTLFRLITSEKNNATSCGMDTGNIVTITVRPQSLFNYPDLRVHVCFDDGRNINLSKYIDTLDLSPGYPQWNSLSGVAIGLSNGVISGLHLASASRVNTFTYTVSNSCANDITRKVYVETLKPGRKHPLRDTIVICVNRTGTININQIFGIDAGFDDKVWSYYSKTPGDVNKYVTMSKSSAYYGAVVMNGKGIYDSSTISYIQGTTNKKVVFTYTPTNDSCLRGKSYTIVIILTGS